MNKLAFILLTFFINYNSYSQCDEWEMWDGHLWVDVHGQERSSDGGPM